MSSATPPAETSTPSPGDRARRLLRSCSAASLGTLLDGWPYASLVNIAADVDASPILLTSTLAEHTRNFLKDERTSLLYDATMETPYDDRLTGARVSVQGTIWKVERDHADYGRIRGRYLARHPAAAQYADFGDFAFYRVKVTRAHLVAGFGQIHWIDAAKLLIDPTPYQALAEAEADVVAHMNEDHAEAVGLYATQLLGRPVGAWQLTGVDCEGCDLRLDKETARLDFAKRVDDAEGARVELVRLVKQARRQRDA